MQKPSKNLYLAEAINAHFTHQYGEVLLLPKSKHIVLSALVAVWLLLSGVFIYTQAFSNTAEVKGWIEPQLTALQISAKESAGVVEQVWVENGDAVVKGQALLSIQRQAHSLLGQQNVQQKLAQMEKAQQLRVQSFESQESQKVEEIAQLQQTKRASHAQLRIVKQQRNNAERSLTISADYKQQTAALAKQGLLANTQAQQAHKDWLDMQNREQSLVLELNRLEQALAQIAHQETLLERDIAQVNKQKQLSEVQHQQSIEALQQSLSYTLFAPESGHIDNLFVNSGDSVQFNQQLMQILPKVSKLKGMLSVPTNKAGFLLASQQVKIRIDGFPYQQYGAIEGEISRISRQVLLPKDSANIPIQMLVPSYIVEVDLASSNIQAKGESWPIASGMTINASVQLDQSTLFEWMTGPLYAAVGE